MMSSKCFRVAVLAIAVIGFGFFSAGDAFAGKCKSDRGYDRSYDRGHDRGWSHRDRHYSHRDYGYSSRAKVTYRNDNVRFSVSVGSHRSYDRGYHQSRYRSSCSKTVVYQSPPPTGHWKRVYHAPVYETHYRSCGTPYRVCVRAGYYERVWVTTGCRY